MRYLSKEQKKLMRLIFNLEKLEFDEFLNDIKTDVDERGNDSKYSDMSLYELERLAKLTASFFDKEYKQSRSLVQNRMPMESFICDLITLLHSLLLELFLNYFSPNSNYKVLQGLSREDKARFSYMTLSYVNILQALVECRNNYFEGKYLIGGLIFRYYSELMESSILALVDQEYFEIIKEFPENKRQGQEKWKKNKSVSN